MTEEIAMLQETLQRTFDVGASERGLVFKSTSVRVHRESRPE